MFLGGLIFLYSFLFIGLSFLQGTDSPSFSMHAPAWSEDPKEQLRYVKLFLDQAYEKSLEAYKAADTYKRTLDQVASDAIQAKVGEANAAFTKAAADLAAVANVHATRKKELEDLSAAQQAAIKSKYGEYVAEIQRTHGTLLDEARGKDTEELVKRNALELKAIKDRELEAVAWINSLTGEEEKKLVGGLLKRRVSEEKANLAAEKSLDGQARRQLRVEEALFKVREKIRFQSSVEAVKEKILAEAAASKDTGVRDAQKDLDRLKRDQLRDAAEAEQEGRERAMRDRLRDEHRHSAEMLKHKLEGIGKILGMGGQGLVNLLGDKNKIMVIAGAIVGVAGGIKLLSFALRFFERLLKQPSLIRESSNKSMWAQFLPKKQYSEVPVLNDLIVAPDLKIKLQKLSRAIVSAKKFQTPLPGVILYGEPGNGKTMFMRALAAESGMHFAMMSGGDVSALLSSGGKNIAVTELHKCFDWAVSHGPTLLFIDEADAFLRKGRSENLSEGLSAVQNAYLNRTGSSSELVCIVISTNKPGVIDPAAISRTSMRFKFDAPGRLEREKMYKAFLERMSSRGVGKLHLPVDISGELKSTAFVDEVVTLTDGFSGRDMAMKLFDSVQRDLVLQDNLVLTPNLIRGVLDHVRSDDAEFNQYSAL